MIHDNEAGVAELDCVLAGESGQARGDVEMETILFWFIIIMIACAICVRD